MFGRKKKKPSLFRRLVYFVLLASGSGAGIGGYALKDHPTVQALLTLVAGDAGKDDASDVEKSLVGDVVDLLQEGPGFSAGPASIRSRSTRSSSRRRCSSPGIRSTSRRR